MIYFNLFFNFLKIGFISFGGGYAMISLLQQEVIKNSWMSIDEFLNIVAFSQITPGPIAINMATFIGFDSAKLFGAILATIAVSLPSMILVSIIRKFNNIKILDDILFFLKPIILASMIYSLLIIFKKEFFNQSKFNFLSLIIFLLIFLINKKSKKSIIVVLIISGFFGIFFRNF